MCQTIMISVMHIMFFKHLKNKGHRRTAQDGAGRRRTAQDGAGQRKTAQDGAGRRKIESIKFMSMNQ